MFRKDLECGYNKHEVCMWKEVTIGAYIPLLQDHGSWDPTTFKLRILTMTAQEQPPTLADKTIQENLSNKLPYFRVLYIYMGMVISRDVK